MLLSEEFTTTSMADVYNAVRRYRKIDYGLFPMPSYALNVRMRMRRFSEEIMHKHEYL